MQQPLAFHLLAKPTGASCNLDCKYCFFLSKDRLYGGGALRMADDVLEPYIWQLLAAQPNSEVNVTWQGGEPTLMGLEFFRRGMDLVAKHRRRGQKIMHTIQTNGVLLNDEWARFFKAHGILVGLSIDGPKDMHDAYRVAKGGDLYACDHYVEPDYLLGNIGETPLTTLVASPKQRKFGRDKFDTLPKYCRECEVLLACYGECPRNRFTETPDEAGLN